ncbi:MAG: hypothetical protein ACR2P6_00700 [Gammaproteobacteria bacterium]
MFSRFLLSLVVLILGACTTTVQIYEGDGRSRVEVANISRDYDASGRRIKVDGIDIGSKNVELLPGEYLLSVAYKVDWKLLADEAWTVFPIFVSAGEKYRLHSMPLQVHRDFVAGDAPNILRAKTWQRGYTVGKSNYEDRLFFWLENKHTGEYAGGTRPESAEDDRSNDYRVPAGTGVVAEL